MTKQTISSLEALEIAEGLVDRHGNEFLDTVHRLRQEVEKELENGDTNRDPNGDTFHKYCQYTRRTNQQFQ